jgi:hypothetical protein
MPIIAKTAVAMKALPSPGFFTIHVDTIQMENS